MKKSLFFISITVVIMILANCNSQELTVAYPDYIKTKGGTVHGTVIVENMINNKVELLLGVLICLVGHSHSLMKY